MKVFPICTYDKYDNIYQIDIFCEKINSIELSNIHSEYYSRHVGVFINIDNVKMHVWLEKNLATKLINNYRLGKYDITEYNITENELDEKINSLQQIGNNK